MSTLRQTLGGLRVPEQIALAPDGRTIATVVRSVDLASDDYVRRLHLVDVATGTIRAVGEGRRDADPIWISDSEVVFARRDVAAASLWTVAVEGSQPRRRADLPTGVALFRCSPDGHRVAWVESSPIHPTTAVRVAPLAATTPDEALTVLETDERVLDVVWSGDAGRLAAILTESGVPGDLDVTRLWSLDPDGVEAAFPVGPEGGYLSAVGFSGDGEIVGVGRADQEVGNAHLLACAPGRPHDWRSVTAGDRNIRLHGPAPSARTVLVGARDGGPTALFEVRLDDVTAAPRRLTPSQVDVLAFTTPARSGLVAAIIRTPDSYGALAVVAPDAAAVTTVGEWAPATPLRRPVPHRWSVTAERSVHGWVLGETTSGRPQPLVVDLHGGPHLAWTGCAEEAHLHHQELVRRGWLVVLPNTSGSDGYGERHLRRVVGAWGVPDAEEVATIVSALVARGLADPEHVALVGYSYGGLLVNLLTTQDLQVAAAVAGGSMADLAEVVDDSAEGAYLALAELGARPADDPERYRRLSPISYVDRVRTPTLLLHAGADEITPARQARRWHDALREQGVPTELHVYPDADHDLIFTGRPAYRGDYHDRLVDWLTRHTGPRHENG
ncbi:prolyl oligopeptidase family serine peptidase [Nocardioides carbamazepini]|uniref:prolyl oligopeptidase family serine peptidase n=1 Tax=Nocardioides carbamazepini TaxID=2854259 RepID=UPI00214A54CC|nr:prolyl oligopeptidase family serine peptidase [Nocardioides carbamazepini]MCR1783820.1 prolyl oligopeptidase family serine peptidase [Nocardioides carbamazepini]